MARTGNGRRGVVPAVVAIVLVVVVAWASGLFSGSSPVSGILGTQSKGPAPLVTKAKFDQVLVGMSIERVEKIIGASGKIVNSTEVDDFRTDTYTWTNADGSKMTAVFENDKLIEKTQSGLQ